MLVNVNFTLDVPKARLAEMRQFMSSDTNIDLIYSLKGEGEDMLIGYLEDNGFRDVKVVRRDGRTL